ncbi:MAG: hypothetical protein J0M02_15635 [Planctomycetes bacterium]|nr:hypothetical protein [Planctomycetota bacterium]
MPLYAFSLVAVSAIAAWSAVHHGLMAWRQRDAVQRSFALLAIVVAAECIGRTIYHAGDSLPLLRGLDKLNSTMQLLECWLLLDFVDRFTGSGMRRLVLALGVVLAGFAALVLALPQGLMAHVPTAVVVHEMPWGEAYALMNAPYGTPYWFMVSVAGSTVILDAALAWRAWRRTGRRRQLALLASLLLIFAAVGINITGDAVGAVIPPLVEHGFAGLALVMGAVLTDQALTAARLEERLRRSERLTALGQLAGGVAHDFGNILTGVIGSAELLEGSLASRPKEQELMRAVATSGRRGLALVQQLTAFASGRQIAAERIELHAMLREVAALVQTGRGRTLTVDLQLRAPLTEVDGDPAQLHSLVLNLLVNARDAMGQSGGRVTIRSGNGDPPAGAALRHRPIGEHLVWFSVSDTGPGMSAEVQARIFEPFFTTKGDAGTGLGLAQADKALLALGGAVAIDSAPGRGTTFTVWLPLTEDSSCFLPAAGTRVLVWVGDETLRLLIEQTLDTLGYRTLHSLEAAAEGRIHAIIADEERWRLPDGPQQRLPGVPALLLGGKDAEGGACIPLPRPFEPRALAAALRTLAAKG